MALARTYKELRVWENGIDLAMRVYEHTRNIPAEEKLTLTDPMVRAARGIATNIADAWRRRRYRGAFVERLSDAESQATHVQIAVEFARRLTYLTPESADALEKQCDEVLAQLGAMIQDANRWCGGGRGDRSRGRRREGGRDEGGRDEPARQDAAESAGDPREERSSDSSGYMADEVAEFRDEERDMK